MGMKSPHIKMAAGMIWVAVLVSSSLSSLTAEGVKIACNEPATFTCESSKKCIPEAWRCDGEPDCTDKSDEANCGERVCNETTSFLCESSKTCIPKTWRCDGQPDCADMSDEANCDERMCNKTTSFTCESSKKCIPKRWRCDGEPDCTDKSDETNCPEKVCNPKTEFTCKSDRKCLPKHWMCDKDMDCADGSDEDNCTAVEKRCSDREFTCQNGDCIHLNWYCDGEADCADKSDELKCKEDCFRCTSDTCIPKSMLCDGETQCKSGADEKDCKNDTRKGETNLLIVSRYAGFMYTTVYADGKDYISNMWRFASKEQVALDFDYQSKFLFWTSPKEKRIYRSTIPLNVRQSNEEEQTNVTVIVSDSIGNLEGIAVDWINKRIYWTDSGRISVTDYNGRVQKVLISTIDKPKAIKVDPKSGMMYWTDCGNIPLIERATMDGNHKDTIVSRDLSSPNGLAIDKQEERLYWVDGGTNKIESVDMDGDNRKLMAEAIMDGYALVCTKHFMYVTLENDGKLFRINRIDGSKSDITPDYLGTPMDITVYGKQEKVRRLCNVDTCRHLCLPTTNEKYLCHCDNGNQTEGCLVRDEDTEEVPPSTSIPSTTADVTNTSETTINDVETTVFEDVSTALPSTTTSDTTTTSDGLNTTPTEATDNIVYMLLGTRYHIELVTHHITNSRWERSILYRNLTSAIGIDYDYASGLVFWTDVSRNEICSAQLETDVSGGIPVRLFDKQVIANTDVETAGCIAVDWIRKQVYWTDEALGTISVANYDGTDRRTIINSDLDNPRGIKVDPMNRMLYWCDWGDPPKIERALMDGSSRQTLVNASIGWPNGIALDTEEDRLYWVDGKLRSLDSVGLDGSDRKEVATDISFPFSVAVTKNTLYVSSWGLRPYSISQFDKLTGRLMDAGRNAVSQAMSLAVYEQQKQGGESVCNETTSFLCESSRKCIPKTWRCDGQPDCADMSDEANCGDRVCNKTTSFTCESSKKCIPKRWRCYGEPDCTDKSDEANCPKKVCNPKSEFTCKSDRKCLPKHWMCDKDRDCVDGSDEDNCTVVEKRCSDREFTCQNGDCILLSWYCDGDADCADKSDELKCKEDCFRCTSDTCIPKSMLCDGEIQCKSGADEKDCKNDTRNGKTNLLIVNRYAGFMYTTVYADGKDYISNMWRFASKEQVALDFDYQSKLLFWTSPKEKRIYRSTIPSNVRQSDEEEQTNVTVIVSDSIGNLEGIAVDWINKRIYWTDSGRISVTDYNGRVQKVLISTIDKPKAIKVDPKSGMLYWTDCGNIPLIERATMDGNQKDTIVSRDLSSPNGLAIDKQEERLYWVDGGTNKIESVDMDGGNRKLVAEAIIDGYALITTKRFVYVTLENDGKVFRINKMDGSKSDITPDYLGTPMDITVYGKQEKVRRLCNVDTCRHLCLPTINEKYACHCDNGNQTEGCLVRDEDTEEVPPSTSIPSTTTDVTNTSETTINDVETTVFEDVSTALPSSTTSDTTTTSDGMNTTSTEATDNIVYMLLGTRSHIELVTHHITDSRWERSILYSNMSSAIGIDYDYASGLVFWTDVTRNEICSAQLETDVSGRIPVSLFDKQIIANSDVETAGCIAVDWIRKQVYWTDEALGTISVANYDGTDKRTIINSDLDNPRGIKVDPINRMLYWSDWGDPPKIERAQMDGSSRQTLVNACIGWPNGIALDTEEHRLYWVDGRLRSVESVGFDGSDRKEVATDISFPFSVAVTKNALYVSSWGFRPYSISQFDKLTGRLMDAGRNVEIQAMSLAVYEQQKQEICEVWKCSKMKED